MFAITNCGSVLHRAVGDISPPGTLQEQRRTELRMVLGGVGLAGLLPSLMSAQVRTLANLLSHSLQGLQAKLSQAGGSILTAAQRRELTVLGLRNNVQPPRPGNVVRR